MKYWRQVCMPWSFEFYPGEMGILEHVEAGGGLDTSSVSHASLIGVTPP